MMIKCKFMVYFIKKLRHFSVSRQNIMTGISLFGK